jgi:hypothetical protein
MMNDVQVNKPKVAALSHTKREKTRASRRGLGFGRVSFGDVSGFCAKPRKGDTMELLDMEGSVNWQMPNTDTGELGFTAMSEKAKNKTIAQHTADATRRMEQLASNKRNDRVKRNLKKQK